jgi:23S rRNA (guanine745-N1)-methyltransferase
MTVTAFQALACPLDGDALERAGSLWRCAAGHSFDIAREGYIHLLPVQKKRSRDPGDSKAMILARRRFLNSGSYKPIAAAATQAVLAEIPDNASLNCLDAGCGEGYYLRELAGAIHAEQTLAVLGLDISKWAVISAAKQQQAPCWVVGSNANLPVQSSSMDRVLCMFGFPVYAEFARVLKPGGVLLQVDAGPDHLRELREIIYPSLKPERPADLTSPSGFSRLSTGSVSYPLQLNSAEQIGDLLTMTPHFYRASVEGRARAALLTELSVTVDVRLLRFGRKVEQDQAAVI